MPNNQVPGILEDFVQWLVPADDSLWDYVLQCVSGIEADSRRFPESRKSKAEIHTWLAWQNEPGKPLGAAINAKYLDANAESSRLLVDWVCRVYGLDTTATEL